MIDSKGWLVVVGGQGAQGGVADEVVVPDGGCQGQDALGDAGCDAVDRATFVALEVELVLEGVEDGFDDLADLLQRSGAGPGSLVAGRGAQRGGAGLGQVRFEGGSAVTVVNGQNLAWLGGQGLEGADQGLASSALAPVRAQATGRPWGVVTRCRRSPRK